MNIEKIKNYNQRVLAAIFTIILAGLVISLLVGGIGLVVEWFNSRKPGTNVLLADDKVDDLSKDSLRRQIISYNSPKLVDSNNLIYLFSASVLTLQKAEKFSGSSYYALDEVVTEEISSKRLHPSVSFQGSFNNLLTFDYKIKATEKICTERMIGSDLSFEYFNDEILIVFNGADADTDGDGKVTLLDFNSLFIYSLKDKRLRKIKVPQATLESREFIGGKKDLLLTFGIDRNKDNEFDRDDEPQTIMLYDFDNDKLIKTISPKLDMELQKLVDKI